MESHKLLFAERPGLLSCMACCMLGWSSFFLLILTSTGLINEDGGDGRSHGEGMQAHTPDQL